MSNPVQEFNDYRSRMNKQLLSEASTILRCEDCIKYHFERYHEEKLTKKAVMEALEIATFVGGSILIPHLRKAYEHWQRIELNTK